MINNIVIYLNLIEGSHYKQTINHKF